MRVSQFESHFRHETAFYSCRATGDARFALKAAPKILSGCAGSVCICVCLCVCVYVCVPVSLSEHICRHCLGLCCCGAWPQASPRGLRCTDVGVVVSFGIVCLLRKSSDADADRRRHPRRQSQRTHSSQCVSACACVCVCVCPAYFLC